MMREKMLGMECSIRWVQGRLSVIAAFPSNAAAPQSAAVSTIGANRSSGFCEALPARFIGRIDDEQDVIANFANLTRC
ncbi:MAG: hypothetical protein H7A12_00725 [Pseudomonadales bacterium]|jgi:hypothetical protein|nr:hypothetical protein [Pseudomonadales bacterium]MCP5336892.1 hypothetical protein [Pseudomonadales bacterium]